MLHGNKNILLAAWSGEEIGILGSSHFVNQLMKSNQSLQPQLDAAINLDMVGHLREKLVLQGIASSEDWKKIIDKIKVHHSLSVLTQNDPYLPTDVTAFYLNGVPILNFFTGAHDFYHTPRDKPDTLNYAGIQAISYFVMELILALEEKQNAMKYGEVKESRKNTGREFRIYLGTIPDYASADINGVKLAGVARHSPAELAGMRRNDVIFELAGNKIHDIYDYTFALNHLRVGKPVALMVLREQKKVRLTVVARMRE